MSQHFFAIPALDPRAAEEELNRFCGAQRVVAIDRQFVAAGRDSFWAICLVTASGDGPLPDAVKARERRGAGRGELSRIDYKAVLSDADFALYAELRAWRKGIAEQEGVPIYAVFSNEQLAEIVRRRVDTLAALGAIEGIGAARLERYGKTLLERLRMAAVAGKPED